MMFTAVVVPTDEVGAITPQILSSTSYVSHEAFRHDLEANGYTLVGGVNDFYALLIHRMSPWRMV